MATKKSPAKKKAAKKKAPAKKAKKSAPVNADKKVKVTGPVDEVTIRMYCHGFGDCFLLTFRQNNAPVFRMLIDCGMLTGNSELMKTCIEHIRAECEGHLDVVVQSHEHKDHISGFNARDEHKKLLWDSIEVDDVWLAWTENTAPGGDPLAIDLKEKFTKKKMALAKALGLYNQQIGSAAHKSLMETEFKGSDYHAAQQRYASALQQMLLFYDLGPEEVKQSLNAGADFGLTMKDAMKYFVHRNEKNGSPHISFWDPGSTADQTNTGMEGIRFYFLGPPKNYDLLRKMDDKEHVEMYLSDMGLSDNFYVALTDMQQDSEALSPFSPRYNLKKEMLSPEEKKDPEHVMNLYDKHTWRNIGTDWLHNAGSLALHLDSYTNNTSLVIAIEFEHSGKVLLFPADAQIGNWISWTETKDADSKEPRLNWTIPSGAEVKKVTAADLLERTVFYKVGHHASHNATAKKHGLELMESKELAAMIPVDEEVAGRQGKKGWKMPAEDLYIRLQEKTKGRIIRLDKGNLLKNGTEEIIEGAKPTQQQRQVFNNLVTESTEIIDTGTTRRPLYWEYTVKG